jgi:hypothetical protein
MKKPAKWLLPGLLVGLGAAVGGTASGAGLRAIERSPAVSPAAGWQAADDEADDEFVNAAGAPAAGAWDGVYLGTVVTRQDGRMATVRITVKDGRGTGTASRLDCGTAPVSLRISPVGEVSGTATVFGPTCLKSEVAVRGRAVAGLLQLRLGTLFVELVTP